MSDSENPFAPPQAELERPDAGTLTTGERSLEDAMAGNWSITPVELIKQAWALKDGAKALFLGAIVISGLAGAIASGLSKVVTPEAPGFLAGILIPVVAGIVMLPLTAPLQAGVWRLQIKRAAGGNPELGEMFGQFGKVVPLCIGSLIVIVAMYIGLALLILPGLYIAIAGSLTVPLISERGLAPMDAFKTSLKAVGSHFFDVFVLYFLTGLVAVGGVLALGIGLIWALPTVLIVNGLLYLTIFGWEDKG